MNLTLLPCVLVLQHGLGVLAERRVGLVVEVALVVHIAAACERVHDALAGHEEIVDDGFEILRQLLRRRRRRVGDFEGLTNSTERLERQRPGRGVPIGSWP
mgnify:CR=1 FL=1